MNMSAYMPSFYSGSEGEIYRNPSLAEVSEASSGSGSGSGGANTTLLASFWETIAAIQNLDLGALKDNADSEGILQNKDLQNTHGEKLYSLEEFLKFNQGKTYKEIINQRAKSSGLPGGPEMRYVKNPLDGNVMDMRHVLVVGFKGTSIGGLIVENLQYLTYRTRPSAYDKQDYYSNNIGSSFYNFYSHPASYSHRKRDFTTVLYQFIYGKITIPDYK